MGAVALMSSSVPEHGNYKGVRKGSGEEHQEERQSFFRAYQLFLKVPRPLSQGFLLLCAAQKSSGFDWQKGLLIAGKKLVSAGVKYKGFPGTAQKLPAG